MMVFDDCAPPYQTWTVPCIRQAENAGHIIADISHHLDLVESQHRVIDIDLGFERG